MAVATFSWGGSSGRAQRPEGPEEVASCRSLALRLVLVDGELDQIVVGIAEVHARGRATGAGARPGAGLQHDVVAFEQGEHLVHGAVPFDTEVRAARRGAPRAQVANLRRRVRGVDVDLLRVVDADGRHVGAAGPR